LLEDLQLDPVRAGDGIDTGAEEELFRRIGQQAATKAMVARWEQSDRSSPIHCRHCQQPMQSWGRRGKRIRTICGSAELTRRVYYCPPCGLWRTPLDERLHVDETGITPGLSRLICRTALELAYDQSQRLLTDTLGFSPCSAREIERVANRHGEQIERQVSAVPAVLPARPKTASRAYCLAIDAVMIPGLPDPDQHCLNWHDVKLAVAFDPTHVREPFYVAGREDKESFGTRLWHQLETRQLAADRFHMVLADGAPWIWNLVEEHLPGVPQLLDFYHAAEHLHATAAAIWAEPGATAWWQRRLDQLKQGNIDKFFAALKLLARSHTTTDPDLSPTRLHQYFEENRRRLIYRWALDRGLPIGSGTVESAARHIVQQRLKQSGMRWSDPGAQAVLNLRTLHRNGLFEQYWESHAA
jgi:hypothetical protein